MPILNFSLLEFVELTCFKIDSLKLMRSKIHIFVSNMLHNYRNKLHNSHILFPGDIDFQFINLI